MDTADYSNSGESGLTFRDYMQVLFRQRAVIVVSVFTVIATAFLGLKLQGKYYEASVKMLITAQKQVEAPYYRDVISSREGEQTITQSEIVKSDPVLMRVVGAQQLQKRPIDDEKKYASSLRAKWIGFQTATFMARLEALPSAQRDALLYRRAKEVLKQSIQVSPVRDTNIFTITVRDYNPIGAAILANTVSRAYVIFDLEQQLAEMRLKYGDRHPRIRYLQENIAKMEKSLDGQPLEDIDAIGPASVKIIEQASVPLEPTGTSKKLVFLLAAAMSVFLGVMLAFVFEYADQTLKFPRDIERVLSIPFIGSVRRRRFFQKAIIDYTRKKPSAYSHSYQTICDHLHLLFKDKGISSLMIAPTLKSEDSATFVANVANCIGTVLKQRVIVVDTDLRNPALHKAYKIPNNNGLADFLEGKVEFKDAVHSVKEGVSVIPAGSTAVNPILLFEPEKMEKFMKNALKEHDLVIVRSAPMRDHKDPSILAKYMDGLLVMVEEGQVRRHVIQHAYGPMVGKARAALGVVLVNRTYPLPKWIYDRI